MTNLIFDFINLHNGEEAKDRVLETVKSNTSFRGSNIWILACAIVIASVGLNVNSTAVIIGAMLISPLMGPIVGAGFALAMYDFDLLKKSVRNLFIATIVSLTVATIYFVVTPFKETQSELLARTSPNIYDVLIAFFGGLVGVIALTRVEKGNPIPGVAIATALMPPLCTAGYGIAIGNFSYFGGAFYLYIINCFFICISTFLIVKYLKYEPVRRVVETSEKKLRYGISILIVFMIVPSFYMAYTLFQEKNFHQKVEQFIANELVNNGYTLVFKKITYNSNPKKIDLAFLTKKFSDNEVKELKDKILQYGIYNTEINIRQDTKDMKNEILHELGKQNKIVSEKDILIYKLQEELHSYKIDNSQTIKEMAILFPELKDVSIGRHLFSPNTDSAKVTTVLLYRSASEKQKFDVTTLQRWLEQKFNTSDVKIVQQK